MRAIPFNTDVNGNASRLIAFGSVAARVRPWIDRMPNVAVRPGRVGYPLSQQLVFPVVNFVPDQNNQDQFAAGLQYAPGSYPLTVIPSTDGGEQEPVLYFDNATRVLVDGAAVNQIDVTGAVPFARYILETFPTLEEAYEADSPQAFDVLLPLQRGSDNINLPGLTPAGSPGFRPPPWTQWVDLILDVAQGGAASKVDLWRLQGTDYSSIAPNDWGNEWAFERTLFDPAGGDTAPFFVSVPASHGQQLYLRTPAGQDQMTGAAFARVRF